jgi:hypothetical protein
MRKLLLALAALALAAGGLILSSGSAVACIPCPGSTSGSASTTTRCCGSPIILDVDGSGFHLTSVAGGVPFDFFGNGHPVQMAWIAPGSTNALLVMPRNGKVTDGQELFGNLTPQPRSADPNGFLALASLNALTGGQNRSVIDSHDPLYYKLRLWQFSNQNGKVVTGKLSTLPQLGIKAIYLNYSTTTTADQYGNQFRYQARVVSTNPHAGKYTYDVFFSVARARDPARQRPRRPPARRPVLDRARLAAVHPARPEPSRSPGLYSS